MALGWRSQYLRYKDFFLNVLQLYKKRRDLRMFLEVILSLSTVIVFLLFALKPTAITIIDLVKQIKEKEATVTKLDQKISNLRTAQSVYAQETDSIPIIESAVPNFASPNEFANQIQGMANKNSVQVLGISFGEITLIGKEPPKKKSKSELKTLPAPALEMPVSISINGTFPNLLTFVRDMENNRRPVKLDILNITSTLTETGQTITMIVSGRVPFLGNEN